MTSAASGLERLELADWRRRVAALYVEVRAMYASDPAIALAHWRAQRELLFRTHPQSPVTATDRPAFEARHFEHDARMAFAVELEPAAPPPPDAQPLALPDSGQGGLAFSRVGTVRIPLPDGERPLSVFWLAGYAGGLFLPFRDATNGQETYGAGRYLLDTAKSADLGTDASGRLILDFNFAYQPSCAFDPRWACPLAPPENRLAIPIRAGERLA